MKNNQLMPCGHAREMVMHGTSGWSYCAECDETAQGYADRWRGPYRVEFRMLPDGRSALLSLASGEILVKVEFAGRLLERMPGELDAMLAAFANVAKDAVYDMDKAKRNKSGDE